jgi:hypothetical protein
MVLCLHCGSSSMRNKGYKTTKTETYQRFQCRDCNKYSAFRGNEEPQQEPSDQQKQQSIKLIEQSIDLDDKYDGIVVTSCLNDTKIFKEFFDNLVEYCKFHNYKLLVIKNKYLNPTALNGQKDLQWPVECIPYFLETTMRVGNQFKVIGDCNIQATASHPLTGIDGLSEGITTIVGHPVLQLKSMPVNKHKDHVVLHSTGSVSVKSSYSATKAGYRASFHHCYGAIVVALDKPNEKFHIRQLLADKTGTFHDLNEKWENAQMSHSFVDAIYLGDEHVVFRDKKVSAATFGPQGIVDTLKPKYIIRGDVLDCFSVSHHHANDFFARYKKHNVMRMGNVMAELRETVSYIHDTTPDFATSLLINGNHESHLDKWLNVADPKQDLVNAKFYHQMMWYKLDAMEKGHNESAFSHFLRAFSPSKPNVKICPDDFVLHGINLSMHGDRGPNGARGSGQNLSKIGERSIVGHSHCLTDDHSALTQAGWKKVYDIIVGELVLTYDHATKSNVWLPNKKTHVMRHTGKLVKITTNNVQQTVTPNHMLSLSDGRYINVCEAITTEMPAMIPVSAVNGISNPNVIDVGLSDIELRKIVAFCADGSICRKTGKNNYRFHLKKSRKLDRLYEFFGKDYTPLSGKNFGKNGSTKITISMGTESYQFLEKWIPKPKCLPEFFRTLPAAQKEIVIDELKYWDGTFDTGSNGRQYSSAKESEVDLISSILVELGYRTSVLKKQMHKNRNETQSYVITWNHDKNMHTGNIDQRWQGYRNKAWGISVSVVDNIRVSCLETDNRNFWIRDDVRGKVSLTGNSPSVIAGTWVVGTASLLQMEYNDGPSSWMHAHCVIHKNGKRQMIFIIDGDWK